jgi:hypothetical protein
MITGNFYKVLAYAVGKTSGYVPAWEWSNNSIWEKEMAVSNASNAILFAGNCMGRLHEGVYGYGNKSGLVFGDGDTAPSLNDVILSGNTLNQNLSASLQYTSEYDDNGATCTTVATLTNNSSESLTIREVGCYDGYTSSVLDRTLLETPITIAPGGVGQVTYTVRMNYPTA